MTDARVWGIEMHEALVNEQQILDDLVAKWISLGVDFSRGAEGVTGVYAYAASEEGQLCAEMLFEQEGVIDFPGDLHGVDTDVARIRQVHRLMFQDVDDAERAFREAGVPLPIEYRVFYQPESGRTEAQVLQESKFAYPSEKDMTEGIRDWLGARAPKLFGRGAPRR